MLQKPKKVIQVPHLISGRPMRPRPRGAPPGVRINIKPSSGQSNSTTTKQEEDAKLRAQVEKEISNRFRTCSHAGYACSLPVLSESEFCARHILQDSAAPYRQCSYMYMSGKKCPLPAPLPTASDTGRRESGLCFEHARSTLAARQRATAPPPTLVTPETLLNSLQHYVKTERTRTTSCASAVSVVSDPADDEKLPTTIVDPFKQIDASAVSTRARVAMMEACSGSESDADSVTLGRDGSAHDAAHEDLSGDERVPYDGYPLRHATVYTGEETVCEARTALRLLQTAYMRQMSRLRSQLRAERARYVRALRRERERHCSISSQVKQRPILVRERKQLKKLKAYASYHKKHGVDAVLARKLYHKRVKVNQTAPPRVSAGRCVFTEGGVRCETNSLPAAKHCLKHILTDTQQVLYVECGAWRGGVVCAEPTPLVDVHGLSCRYHTNVPAYTVFTMKKDETDSDSDTNTAEDSAESQLETDTPCESDSISRTTAQA